MEDVTTFDFDVESLKILFQENEEGIEITSMKVTAACNSGDNYMSKVIRVILTIKDSNDNFSECSLLVKRQPANKTWRETFRCDLAFLNEAVAYRLVVREMNDFCKAYRLSFPHCYEATVEHTILEDLKTKGFKMAVRQQGLDLAHAKRALEELGKFHGTSLAMKHSEPTNIYRLASSVNEIVFRSEKNDSFGLAISNSLRMAIMGLKVFRATGSGSLEDIIYKLQMLKSSAFKKLLQTVRPSEPLSVICHGDFYINNILFKYQDSGEVSDVMVVDLQCFRHASLSLDILYFLFSSLQPGVVASHFDYLLQGYHTSLNSQLQRYAPTATQVSLKEIYDELESHSLYGLIMSILVLPAITALPQNAINIEEVESFTPEDYFERGLDLLSPGYFRKLYQLVMDYVELGYL